MREIRWAEDGPKPNTALRTMVDGLLGKSIRGKDMTLLLRQVAVDTPSGATGIDLALRRGGDDTGYLLEVKLTDHRVPWPGGAGGWILSGDGMEHVSADFLVDAGSWWHDSRSGQIEKVLLAPADREVRLRRTLVRAKD